MNKLPKHFFCTLKDDLKNVDYSKWERSSRTKGLKSTRPAPVHWASAPPGRQAARESHRPISVQHSETPSPTELKRAQSEKSGRSTERSTQKLPKLSSRLSRNLKNDRKEEEAACTNDQEKILKLLVRWRSRAVEELEEHCRLLQDTNQQIAWDIKDTDRHNMSNARELLIQHEKRGCSVAAYNTWSTRQMRQVKAELRDAVQEAKDQLSGLQLKLEAVTVEVLNAQLELHTLKTYKDEEYPVKALQIANMKKELDQLQEAQQDECDSVSALCRSEMANLEKQLQKKQQEVLSAIAKKSLSYVPPLVKRTALHNHTLKREIRLHRQEIMKLEEKNSALLRNIQALLLLRPSSREVFQDVFPKLDWCAPEEDIHLRIKWDACLPI